MRWLAWLLLSVVAAPAATLEVHYAPGENLEAIDVAALDDAGVTIDMAAYVLTDSAVVEALADAADRGVKVRLYLDRGVLATHPDAVAALVGKPGLEARVNPGAALMHLKAYAVDGVRLRTGAGNFSHAGLIAQDNDLVLTDDREAVARFERDFARLFAQGSPAFGS